MGPPCGLVRQNIIVVANNKQCNGLFSKAPSDKDANCSLSLELGFLRDRGRYFQYIFHHFYDPLSPSTYTSSSKDCPVTHTYYQGTSAFANRSAPQTHRRRAFHRLYYNGPSCQHTPLCRRRPGRPCSTPPTCPNGLRGRQRYICWCTSWCKLVVPQLVERIVRTL